MAFTLPGTGRGTDPERARKWRIFWSYLPDWVLTILIWALLYLLDKIDGYRRLFSITDTSLAHPYANPDRVPVWLLAVVCALAPGLIMIFMSMFIRRSFWDAHSAILGFILSLGLSVTITNIIKITVGRPRPDLFGRCQPPADYTEDPVHGLSSWTICTRTDLLQDGFRSFPSGHASFAWAGMWYFILYLCAKLRISNRQGYTWKSWILVVPLMCATLIMITRTMDYRHHATDVIAGGLLGIATAWFAYRQYYPPVASRESYKPYSPRIPRAAETLPMHGNVAGASKLDGGAGRPSTEHLSPARYSANTADTEGATGHVSQGYGYGQSYAAHPDHGGSGYPPSALAGSGTDAGGMSTGRNGGEAPSLRVTRAQRDEEERRGLRSEDVETVSR